MCTPMCASTQATSATRARYCQELVEFYTHFGLPYEFETIEKALDKFKGNEDRMIDALYQKYDREILAFKGEAKVYKAKAAKLREERNRKQKEAEELRRREEHKKEEQEREQRERKRKEMEEKERDRKQKEAEVLRRQKERELKEKEAEEARVQALFGHWWNPLVQKISEYQESKREAVQEKDYIRASELKAKIEQLRQETEDLKKKAGLAAQQLAKVVQNISQLEREEQQAVEAEAFERAQELKNAITQLKLDAEKLQEAEKQHEEKEGAHPLLVVHFQLLP